MLTAHFRTSSPPERAFMTRKSWQHPGRRRHIHGKVQPMDTMRRDPNRLWFWTQFAIYAGCTLYALDLWVIR
jgi:hypothetical protein